MKATPANEMLNFDYEMVISRSLEKELAFLKEIEFSIPLVFFARQRVAYLKFHRDDESAENLIRSIRASGLEFKSSGGFYWTRLSKQEIPQFDLKIGQDMASIPGVVGDAFLLVNSGAMRWRVRFPVESLKDVNSIMMSRLRSQTAKPTSLDYLGEPRSERDYLAGYHLNRHLVKIVMIQRNSAEYMGKDPYFMHPFRKELKDIPRLGETLSEVTFSRGAIDPADLGDNKQVIRKGAVTITEGECSSLLPDYFAGKEMIDGITPLYFTDTFDGEVERHTWLAESQYVREIVSRYTRINSENRFGSKFILQEVSDFPL